MPSQAIRTRYVGATDTKQARITARTSSGLQNAIPYDYELDNEANHERAMQALTAKLKWETHMIAGIFDGDYYWAAIPNSMVLAPKVRSGLVNVPRESGTWLVDGEWFTPTAIDRLISAHRIEPCIHDECPHDYHAAVGVTMEELRSETETMADILAEADAFESIMAKADQRQWYKPTEDPGTSEGPSGTSKAEA